MSELDLEQTISDSIADANLTSEPVETTDSFETPVETAPEAPEAPLTDEVEAEPIEVTSPAQKAAEATQQATGVQDEFGKKFGLQPESVPGRENRIPYSRVKKIVEKAELEARKAAETPYVAKIQEYETQLQEARVRQERVNQFEHVMVNDVPRFIGMLKTLPQYQQFFSQLEQAQAQAQPQAAQEPVDPYSDMPQPDQLMPDGTYMYSMDGLKALEAWNRAQARKEVLEEVNQVYGPIHQEWQAAREAETRIRQVVPVIQNQIAEARTWQGFTDNEQEIVQALRADQRLSLEGAYRKVVVPKLVAAREAQQNDEAQLKAKYRAEILEELRRAPAASSAPTRVMRPSPTPQGSRNLEDIIAAQVATIK